MQSVNYVVDDRQYTIISWSDIGAIPSTLEFPQRNVTEMILERVERRE